MAARLEAHAIDGRIDHRLTNDLLDLLSQGSVFAYVDGLAAETPGLREALGNHVADHDHGRAEKLSADGTREPDRAGTRDVDDGAWTDARRDRAMEAGWENVGEQGQIPDL